MTLAMKVLPIHQQVRVAGTDMGLEEAVPVEMGALAAGVDPQAGETTTNPAKDATATMASAMAAVTVLRTARMTIGGDELPRIVGRPMLLTQSSIRTLLELVQERLALMQVGDREDKRERRNLLSCVDELQHMRGQVLPRP